MDKKDKLLEFLRGREKLKMSDVRSPDYTSDLDNDVIKVKGSPVPEEPVTRIRNTTQKLKTKEAIPMLSGAGHAAKIKALLESKAGKKVLSALPMVGVASAALSGDPAMAAEELADDATGGLLGAVKPDVAGDVEAEREMLAERNALEDYKNSPAAMDKLAKLKALLGK